MEVLYDALSSLSIGILGIFFYTLWRAKSFFTNPKELNLSIFFNENKGAWLWTIMIIVLTSVLIYYVPDVSNGITSFTGLEIATNKASFFTYGLGLSALSNKKQNDRPIH